MTDSSAGDARADRLRHGWNTLHRTGALALLLLPPVSSGFSCAPAPALARAPAPDGEAPEVKPILMLSGALVADSFDGPALDTHTWHRPDWVVKNDPGLTVAVENGRLRISGTSRPTGRHHQYMGVLSTYFRETDVVLSARLRAATSFDRPGRIRQLVHLCTGDWPDFFTEIGFGRIDTGPPRWMAGFLDRIWEYAGYDRYLEPTIPATGREGTEWQEVLIVHDGKTGASQDYLVENGALRAVGPSHRIAMNHAHIELKTDVSVPDVRVEAEFDDVRLYPGPARHPVTIVVDSPLNERRNRPERPIEGLEVRIAERSSGMLLGRGVTDGGGQAEVTLKSDVIYPVAARIEVRSASGILLASTIEKEGARGLYPADVWVVSFPPRPRSP